jgi:hypothetical protein
MDGKLRIKAKGIEIDWEGSVEFLSKELPQLIASIVEALGALPGNHVEDEPATDAPKQKIKTGTFTTAHLAARTSAQTSNDLFKVALAKLQLSDGLEVASRSQIIAEMKTAPRIFKENMVKNLSQAIRSLQTSGQINEPANNKFSLTDQQLEQLKGQI